MKHQTLLLFVGSALTVTPLTAAIMFVGPDSNAGTPTPPSNGALIFKVTSEISISSVSAFANGGSLAGPVSVQIRDYNNSLLGGTTVTTVSPVQNSVWATESLGSPITLAPGTYSISSVTPFIYDSGALTHATYNGSGAITAYDSYFAPGPPTPSIFGIGGTPATPVAGPGWIASGDPRMRVVNFEYTVTAVPESSEFALASGLLALGFGVWRRTK